MWRRLFNARGNTTIMALFIVGVVSSGVYFISNKIIVERKLASQLRRDIHASLALRSITDYIKYGIRKGWCFDDKLLPEGDINKCVNNYDNTRSTMRLMMPPSYAMSLQTLGQTHPADFPTIKGRKASDLMLDKIEIKIDLANTEFTANHPLYKVITNLHTTLVKGIKIKAARMSNMTLPVNGDEVYLEITAEFLDKKGETLRTGIEVKDDDGGMKTQGTQYFRETARFISNPREVNSFVLMLPGSIYLGRSSPPETGHGDLAIAQGTKSDRGMIFNSPVFINQSIFIDKSTYTPATFNDVVVMGNGYIKTADGAPFTANEALGVKRYWADTGYFGGFMRGIDSDGKQDVGLSTLNGVSESTTLNNDTITQCINIIRSQSDMNMTSTSRLVAEPVNDAPLEDKLLEFTNRFSFSQIATGALNLFSAQSITKNDGGFNVDDGTLKNNLDKPYNRDSQDDSTAWYSFTPAYDLTSGTKLVMWAYMKWGSDELKIPIFENPAGDGNQVTISFSPYSKKDVEEIEPKLDAISATVKSRQDKLAALEPLKPTNPASLTVWLNTTTDGKDYKELTNPFDNDSVSAAVVRKNDLEDEYELRKKYFEEPGQLEISSVKPSNGFTERQAVFRNVTVKIINPKNFKRKNTTSINLYGGIDKTTVSPRAIENFTLEGMDYSAKTGGYSTRPRDSKNNVTNDPNVNGIADYNNIHYNFAIDTSDPDRPLYISNRGRDFKDNLLNLGLYPPLDVKINYQKAINKCFDSAGGTNLDAFKPASFAAADFTKVAPDSWHFASPDPKSTYFSEDFTTNIYDFKTGATREKCTVHPGAAVVHGFFVCRTLEILPRSTALSMVGTFIVTKNMIVAPAALKAGITWSSMHNQQSVGDMKQNNTLVRADGTKCNTLYSSTVPFWHPDPGLGILADRIRCSSTFLLQGKGPPRWTAIDPDCGRIGDSTNTQCLKRIRNYNLIQLERVYGL